MLESDGGRWVQLFRPLSDRKMIRSQFHCISTRIRPRWWWWCWLYGERGGWYDHNPSVRSPDIYWSTTRIFWRLTPSVNCWVNGLNDLSHLRPLIPIQSHWRHSKHADTMSPFKLSWWSTIFCRLELADCKARLAGLQISFGLKKLRQQQLLSFGQRRREEQGCFGMEPLLLKFQELLSSCLHSICLVLDSPRQQLWSKLETGEPLLG